MSIVMVRRSTRCARSMAGMTNATPGPRGPPRRPRRNTTSRSYSRTTLIPLAASASRTSTNMMPPGMRHLPSRLSRPPRPGRAYAEPQALDAGDLDGLSRLYGLVTGGGPVLAPDQHRALRVEALARHADGTEHALTSSDGPAPLRPPHERPHHRSGQRECPGGSRDETARHLHAGPLGVEEKERAQHEGDQTSDAEHAERRQEGLCDEERDAHDEECQAAVVDREHLERRQG